MIPLERFSDVAVPTGWNNVRCIELLGGVPQTCDYFFDRTTVDVGNWRFGEAMDFDGVNDLITVPHTSSLDFGLNNFSISLWVNILEIGRLQSIIEKATAWNNERWDIRQSNGDKIVFEVIDNGIIKILISTTTVSVGTSYFIVCVKEGDNLYLYIDGKMEKKETGASTQSFSGTSDLIIGRYSLDVTNFARIITDEVRIYNRALTAEEIRTLYKQGSRR
jgi:hypothetical protein